MTTADDRKKVRAELEAAVTRSVTSATTEGRTVEDPAKAAWYVVNMLEQRPDLLAAACSAFSDGAHDRPRDEDAGRRDGE